jgi:hypothetical protein
LVTIKERRKKMRSIYDLAIISALRATAEKYHKNYCYMSQATIMAHLSQLYGISRCRSTLCLHLANLEEEGFFERVKRVTRDAQGHFHQRVTLFKLKAKLFYALARQVYLCGKGLLRTGVQLFRHHKTSLRSVISTDYPRFKEEPQKLPSQERLQSLKTGFEAFKEFCQSL